MPIKWVRIVGAVVAIDEFAGRRVFILDDSSGLCIEATIALQAPPVGKDTAISQNQSDKAATDATASGQHESAVSGSPFEEFNVGDIVDVKGSLSTFRNEIQIKIEKMTPVKSTAQEIQLWEKRSNFRRDILDKPWVLDHKAIRRCRKEAEIPDAELERRRKRLKAITEATSKSKHQRSNPIATTTSREVKVNKRLKPADAGQNLKDLIRQGAVKDKYDALGL